MARPTPGVGAGHAPNGANGANDDLRFVKSRWIIPLVAALVLLVPLLIWAAIKLNRPQLEEAAYTSLEIEARLKAQLIESWLAERRGDGTALSADPEIAKQVAELRLRPDPKKMAAIIDRLDALRQAYNYAYVALYDVDGKPIASIGRGHEIPKQTLALLPATFVSGSIMQSEFYLDALDGLASLNFVVPLQLTEDGRRRTVAALVLHTEPDRSIFPLILTWPSASRSGETLLVQRDNDAVLFINELRHLKNTALKLRRSLTDPQLPAAIAIRSGTAGRTRGVDYRGTEVQAAYRPVASTGWHVVAKMDYEEVMAPLWGLVTWVGLVAAAAILAIGLLLQRFLSQQQRLQRFAAQAGQARTLRESEARLRAVAETARDAIVTVGADGNIVGWNTSATRMFGFPEDEIIGQPLSRIVPERFRQRAMEGFFRMMDGDPERKDGSAAELVGQRRDGSELLVERWVALWSTDAGRFYTCTLRDVTERRREEDALRIAAAAFESHEGMVVTDAEDVILRINKAFTEITGYPEDEAVGRYMNFLKSDRHPSEFYAAMWQQIVRDGTWQGEIWNRNRNGEVHPHWLTISAVRGSDGRVTHYVGAYTDITEQKKIEAGLQQSEEKLRAMTDNIDVVMFLKDLAGNYLHVNRRYETLFHVSCESIQGMTDHDIFPREMADKLVSNDRMVAQSGMPLEIEEQVPHDDGIHTYVSVKFPVRNISGEIYAICGIATDITARKQQDEKMRQLLTLNETILSNALVGIVYLKQRRVVSCNRRVEELFQYGPGELIGASSEVLYDTRETYERIGKVAYETVGEGRSYSTEVMLRHKDGSVFWGALNGCAIDPAHPHDGSIWIYADISERRRAEEESQKLRQAVEQAQVSIVITNRSGVIEYVNPAFTRITGYTRAQAIGQTPGILKSEHTPRATHEDLWRTILAGNIWHGILRNRCKNGDLIWEETSISPILDENGGITHFVAVKEDVTERIRFEKQLEDHQAQLENLVIQRTAELTSALEAAKLADRTKDEFLANITHELRTPLSAVIGFSSLARPFASDARQREYLDKVNTAGKTLAGIIDDLLDLSKIVAGRMDFESRPFSLRQLVARTRSVISYRAQEKGLDLVEYIDDAVPDVLVGDSLRVEQILLNLLSNAVKFTAAGRVELRVGLLSREEGRACLDIEVEDSGIGMSEEGVAMLFKPFSQADASMTRKFGGTGLGLAICKRLAEMMDGGISVTSREGSGSTFCVRLCFDLGAAEDIVAIDTVAPAAERTSYRDVRVLVVDDQPFNRDIVEGLLAAVGITPYLACNGQEALDLLARGTDDVDLVLMDIQMPVMDGITATREIRRRDGLAQLPIIAMTAHTMTHEKEKSLAAGMNDHIGKPFDEAGFYRTLAKWIPHSKQSLAAAAEEKPAAAGTLPALTGVDTRAGLALLLGDEARYRHWLNDFVAEAPATMGQIRQALASGAADTASMAAHTLKGRMGLLGMKRLHAVAAALETAIDGGAPSSELLLDLERGVAAMCDEIRQALGPAATAPTVADPTPRERPAGPPPDDVAFLIERLRAGDSDCDRMIGECLATQAGTAWAPLLQQALDHVEKFDFETAVLVLSADRPALHQLD